MNKQNYLNVRNLLFLACFFMGIGLNATPIRNYVSIKGHIEKCKKASMVYYQFMPVYMPEEADWDSAQVDVNGNFAFNISFPNRISHLLRINYKSEKKVYTTPVMLVGPTDDYIINWNPKKNQVKIEGPNGEGFSYMQKFYDEKKVIWGLSSVQNANIFLSTMQQKISSDLQVFQQLRDSKKIDEAYYIYAQNYIQFYYANRIVNAIQSSLSSNQFSDKKDSLLFIQNEVFKRYPVNENIGYFSDFYSYTWYYVEYYSQRDKKKYQENLDQNLRDSYHLNTAKTLLGPIIYKYYALLFFSRCLNPYTAWKFFDDGMEQKVSLFDKYGREFPEMTNIQKYQQIQQKNIPLLKEIYTMDTIFPENIIQIQQEINSFQDLVKYFDGKPFVIDLWSIFCSPCIADFSCCYQPVISLLQQHNIPLVYVVFDRSNTPKWKKIPKVYNLSGYHFVASDAFSKSMRSVLHASSLSFPTCIIVGENGKILDSKAPRAKDSEKLIKQLKNKLKLK